MHVISWSNFKHKIIHLMIKNLKVPSLHSSKLQTFFIRILDGHKLLPDHLLHILDKISGEFETVCKKFVVMCPNNNHW